VVPASTTSILFIVTPDIGVNCENAPEVKFTFPEGLSIAHTIVGTLVIVVPPILGVTRAMAVWVPVQLWARFVSATVPVFAGRVAVLAPAAAGTARVTLPDVAPSSFTLRPSKVPDVFPTVPLPAAIVAGAVRDRPASALLMSAT